MLIGSPNIKGEITYDTEDEALDKLDELLKSITAYT
jgi:hypothetical protein